MSGTDIRRSLRARILALIACILAVGAVILGIAAYRSATVAAREAYDRLLTGATIQIAENVYLQGGVVSLDPPAAAISTLADFDLVFYKVVNSSGVVVAGYNDLSTPDGPTAGRRGVVVSDGTYHDRRVRIATIAKQMGGDDNWAQVVVAQTLNARQSLARQLTLNSLSFIGVMSGLALIAGALSVRIAFAPLVRLESEIAGRKPDDLREITIASPVETQNLVSAINDFMRRLKERMAIMQRFIADAAHQIRTPIASLDAQIELIESSTDASEQAQHLAALRERTAELARVTNQLLGHATVVHRSEMAHFSDVELNAMAKSVLAQAVPLSLPREVDISFAPSPSPLTVKGDPVSLREAITNLVSNAIVHGARTRLSLSVRVDADMALIEVADDGEGFDPGDAQRLQRPFERGRTGAPGSGLGLAIAAETARAHGGRLRFARSGGLFRVTLAIPRGRDA